MAQIILISGIHGSGKSTLLSDEYKFRVLKASNLISKYNDGHCDKEKVVDDIPHNQNVLLEALLNETSTNEHVFLDGHLCLINKQFVIQHIEKNVFIEMNVVGIQKRLQDRGVYWNIDFIEKFRKCEKAYAVYLCHYLKIPFISIYSDDIDKLHNFATNIWAE